MHSSGGNASDMGSEPKIHEPTTAAHIRPRAANSVVTAPWRAPAVGARLAITRHRPQPSTHSSSLICVADGVRL